jgi:hypothetical protein
VYETHYRDFRGGLLSLESNDSGTQGNISLVNVLLKAEFGIKFINGWDDIIAYSTDLFFLLDSFTPICWEEESEKGLMLLIWHATICTI